MTEDCKGEIGVHGGNVEKQLITEIYKTSVSVYFVSVTKSNIRNIKTGQVERKLCF
jgi:hypothetical protein